jgi:hypothetical protein
MRLSSMTPTTRRTQLLQHIERILRDNEALIVNISQLCSGTAADIACVEFCRETIWILPECWSVLKALLGCSRKPLCSRCRCQNIVSRCDPDVPDAGIRCAGDATDLLPLEPSACDALDRRLLSLGRGADQRFRDLILPEAEAGLIIEFPGGSEREVRQRLEDSQRLLRGS